MKSYRTDRLSKPAGPIMTEAQHWAYLASHNITPMDQATYQRDYAARYEGAAPGSQGQAHDGDPNGQSGRDSWHPPAEQR